MKTLKFSTKPYESYWCFQTSCNKRMDDANSSVRMPEFVKEPAKNLVLSPTDGKHLFPLLNRYCANLVLSPEQWKVTHIRSF